MELQLDRVPEKKMVLIAKLLFPTKRETAQHFTVYFHSEQHNSWFAFQPGVPAHIQNQIVEIIKGFQNEK